MLDIKEKATFNVEIMTRFYMKKLLPSHIKSTVKIVYSPTSTFIEQDEFKIDHQVEEAKTEHYHNNSRMRGHRSRSRSYERIRNLPGDETEGFV